ncbi:hypothetical protein ACYSNV_05500 [Myroides sp. LJL119]
MITFNNQTKELDITDNYKSRLQSSRIMSVAILLLSIGKITIMDYANLTELDYLFFIIVAVFSYLVYKNFFINTSISKIEKFQIKYVKMPKALATKAVIKLNNGKTRDVYGLKNPKAREEFRKVINNAKIRIL